jgi:hypothetical protein
MTEEKLNYAARLGGEIQDLEHRINAYKSIVDNGIIHIKILGRTNHPLSKIELFIEEGDEICKKTVDIFKLLLPSLEKELIKLTKEFESL